MAEKISGMAPIASASLSDLHEVSKLMSEDPDVYQTFSESNQQQLTLFNANAQLASTAQVTGLDATFQRIPAKVSCTVATTTNLNATYNNGSSGVGATLTNAGTLSSFNADGVIPSVNKYVLVKNQTSASQNGIYQLTVTGDESTAWVLTRATFYDSPSEMGLGSVIFILDGLVNPLSTFIQTSTVTTVGSDSVIYAAGACKLTDTNQSHSLSLIAGSNLTADRTLTFTTGDASRTLTISGNVTLNDWFDQNLKTTANVTHNAIFLATSGGTQSELNYYEDSGNITIAFTGAFSGDMTAKFIRIGKIVIFHWQDFTGTSSQNLKLNGSVPQTRWRPQSNINLVSCVGPDNGTSTQINITIQTGGQISIGVGIDQSAYQDTGTAGIYGGSICWTLA